MLDIAYIYTCSAQLLIVLFRSDLFTRLWAEWWCRHGWMMFGANKLHALTICKLETRIISTRKACIARELCSLRAHLSHNIPIGCLVHDARARALKQRLVSMSIHMALMRSIEFMMHTISYFSLGSFMRTNNKKRRTLFIEPCSNLCNCFTIGCRQNERCRRERWETQRNARLLEGKQEREIKSTCAAWKRHGTIKTRYVH